MNQPTPQQPADCDLPATVAQARFLYIELARRLLDADLLVASLDKSAQWRAGKLKADGWRLSIDLHVDESDRVTIGLAAVRDGRHQLLGCIKEDAAPSA
jgi:hypothetical protein